MSSAWARPGQRMLDEGQATARAPAPAVAFTPRSRKPKPAQSAAFVLGPTRGKVQEAPFPGWNAHAAVLAVKAKPSGCASRSPDSSGPQRRRQPDMRERGLMKRACRSNRFPSGNRKRQWFSSSNRKLLCSTRAGVTCHPLSSRQRRLLRSFWDAAR
jgi:hypothetical protein